MKYYWDKCDIKKDLEKLEYVYENSKDAKEKNEIIKAIKVVEEVMSDIVSNTSDSEKELDFQESLDLLSSTAPMFEFVYPYLKKFLRILENDVLEGNFLTSFDDKSSNMFFTEDEMFGLVHDFFKETNKKIYKAFLSLYNNRYKTVRFSEELCDFANGYSYFLPYLNKGYIDVLNSKQDFSGGILTLVHECAHVTSAIINPNRYGLECSFFNEIETVFMELISSDYFWETLHSIEFLKTSKDKLEHYYFVADDVMDRKKIVDIRLSMGNPSYKEFKNCMDDEFYKALLTVEPLRNLDIDVKYLFSYIVAVELYEVYRKDKDLAFRLLDTIIKADNEKENDTIFKTVEPVKSLKKYKNRITLGEK